MSTTSRVNKRALLIGINSYPYLAVRNQYGDVIKNRDLAGCVNDVKLMGALLRDKFAYPEENITYLLEENATREAILDALNALSASVKEDSNDIVTVVYAGHGSTMTDREGDEADGLDSTIVPYDSGRAFNRLNNYPNRDISDDEIYLWLLDLCQKTNNISLIFDSCKSGTVVRDDFGESDRWVEGDTRSVGELPPSPVAAEKVSLLQRANKGEGGWLPTDDRYVLIASCRADETAGEYRVPGTETRHGLFTYYLSQALQNVKEGDTYRDIFEQVTPEILAKAKRPQHPQMEGTRDREIFGTRDLLPMSYVQVSREAKTSATTEAGTVTLAAGAAMGMTKGSEWAVYPAGTKEIQEDTPVLGRVRVSAVRAVDADVEILEEAEAGSIGDGCRAVEELHALNGLQFSVEVAASDQRSALVTNFKDLLGSSFGSLLSIAKDSSAANARVYLLEPRTVAGEDDAVPQLGPIAEATWAVVGRDGKLLMQPRAISEQSDAVEAILENLARIAKAERLQGIVGGKTSELMKSNIQLIVKKQNAAGKMVAVEPEEKGLPVFYDGDYAELTLLNELDTPVYVYLFNIGVDYSISQLYPPAQGANEKLMPNFPFDVGEKCYGGPLPLAIPEGFLHQEGVNNPILFVTMEEADFSSLTQSAVRSVDDLGDFSGADSELGKLLTMSLFGNGQRNFVVPRKRTKDNQWTAVSASFILKRRPDQSHDDLF